MSTNNHLHLLRAGDIARQVARGELRAVNLVESLLARIAALNPVLGAMVDVDVEGAMAQAAQADKRAAAGDHLPLLGVPFSVKDNLWVGRRPATYGSVLFAEHIASRDSWSVARLKAHGAVCIGLTNCSEFACKGVTSNPLHGVTRNPWNTDLTPGGSSGGAVAGVAAGFNPIALGTDAGGSTRRPAAHTGLVGFKCTLGLIPNPWGFDDPSHDLSSIGLIARDVPDCAIMLDALVDYDARDPLSHPLPANMALPGIFGRSVNKVPERTLRIAWSIDLGCGFAIDNDVALALHAAVKRLREAGWKIDNASPAWPPDTAEYPLLVQQHAGLANLFGSAWREDPYSFDPAIATQIEAGLGLSGVALAALPLRRNRLRAALTAFFERYDLLLCPTVPVEPWDCDILAPTRIGGRLASPRGHAAFTPLFNYCDTPALSVPCGFGANGLPLGMQVVGPRYADLRVVQFSAEIERVIATDFTAPIMYAATLPHSGTTRGSDSY